MNSSPFLACISPLLLLGAAPARSLAAPKESVNAPAKRRASSPRLHQLFDTGWRFTKGDPPGASEAAFDDTQWRTLDLPHDWSIEDLPTSPEAGIPAVSAVPGAWRFHAGDDPAWKTPDFEDSAWENVQLPGRWSDINLKAENAYGWYRRRIGVSPELRGKEVLLLIGKVDDVDETFVNGIRVGGMGAFPPDFATAWDKHRRYRVPANVFKCDGTDLIAVRDYNGQADAGIYEAAPPITQSGPFSVDSPNGGPQGYTQGGIGWYRKTFPLPAREKARQIGITFDGVYMNSEVWFNGQKLGGRPYGYTSFTFDLTPFARFGKNANVLSVRVDSTGKTSRWYSGSGIYRHAWLTITDAVRVAQWGVFVSTPQVSSDKALVRVRTTIKNDSNSAQRVTLETRVERSPAKGVAVARGSKKVIPAGGQQDISQAMTVNKPALWSPDSPTLYHLVTTVKVDGTVVDEIRTPFGIRSISVDAAKGFLLNGKTLKIRGGCVHHDNGCLGSCAYDRAEERKVEILKGAGYNAIRTSHNPPSPALLDACDRLGMLVMDEAFDCWQIGKNDHDYSLYFNDWWKRDLDSMVTRDRNHPSVVFWSIGNEIPGQPTPEATKIGSELAARVRQLDPTRPVAQAAYPGETKDLGVFANLDVCGYNYMPGNYGPDHDAHPQRVILGTESFPRACFEAWMPVIDHPYVIGDFVWTAFDYIGEAGLGHADPISYPVGYAETRPWITANCGDFDLCGFKLPASHYRDAVWNTGGIVSCFVEAVGANGKTSTVEGWNWGWIDERPSWTWPGLEGKPVKVRVYSYAPSVRLAVNGRTVGQKPTDRGTHFMAAWDLPYEPGELVATALNDQGKPVGRWVLSTAGKPASIRLTADRRTLTTGRQDLSFVTVEILDSQGVVDPNADPLVRFRLSGPGKIIGVGNGDPRSMESFQQPQRKAYRGRCLVVVKAGGKNGQISLHAESPGLKSTTIALKVDAPSKAPR